MIWVKAVPLFDEADILSQVAGGSERAFTLLFRQYSSKVYSFALKLTKSEEMAEEVVQEKSTSSVPILIGLTGTTALTWSNAWLAKPGPRVKSVKTVLK